jgi:Fe2+ or Zn2+ uptake regulation protein
LPIDTICDDKAVIVASDDPYHLGILSSRVHVTWALGQKSRLGQGDDPVYVKSKCFDPFPFPDPPETLKARIRATAEELDALRKQVQAEHPGLTLTQLYNVLEKIRAGEKLDAQEEATKNQGLVLILKELHEKLDALVAESYGWPENLSDDEILAKLVALNAERAAEEKRGLVRWLRPEYQRVRAGVASEQRAKEAGEQLEAPLVIAATKAQKPAFPASDLERTAAVFAALTEANTPLDAQSIAAKFRQGQKIEPTVARILAAFARMGQFHTGDGERFTQRRGG